jgi:hypothetical protein
MKRFSVHSLAVSALPVSCAADTGIIKVTQETYMLGREGGWESSDSKVRAGHYRDANLFCEKAGKSLILVPGYSDDQSLGNHATAEIHFKCQ